MSDFLSSLVRLKCLLIASTPTLIIAPSGSTHPKVLDRVFSDAAAPFEFERTCPVTLTGYCSTSVSMLQSPKFDRICPANYVTLHLSRRPKVCENSEQGRLWWSSRW